MTFQANISEFAEFMGTEIKRIEKKIPDGGGGQSGDSMIITGNGRPDKPETTDGKITGREPNGAFYNSTNGANVGAFLWQKQNNKWVVISGDTGSRQMSRDSVNVKEGYISLRRVNNTVECSFSKGKWDTIFFEVLKILNSQGKTTSSEWIFYLVKRYQSASALKLLSCSLFMMMTGIMLQ